MPCLPTQRNYPSSGLHSCKWCHCCSHVPKQTHRVTVWGYPRTAGVTQLLPLATREGQQPEMLRVQWTRRSQPGQSCQPHLPQGCSLLCLPGTCLHFPAQLGTVQGWMELAHGHRVTICSGFPRLNLSFCPEIECRWDLRSLGHLLSVSGQMTTVHEETSTYRVIWEIQDRNMGIRQVEPHRFILLEKRESNKQWRGARKALSKLTALGDLFPPLKPHPQTLGMRMDITWILAQRNVAITHNFSLNMSSNAVC